MTPQLYTPHGTIPRYRGMGCTKNKVCISEESFIDIRLGFVVVVQIKKYAYPRNLEPFLHDFKGFPLEPASGTQTQPAAAKAQTSRHVLNIFLRVSKDFL